MNRRRKVIIEANKVSTVEEFVLGGYPYLTCKVIPNSAHIPGVNGMQAVFEEICGIKK